MRKADDFVAIGALRVNPFTICMLGNFSCFCCRLLTFSKLSFSKNCEDHYQSIKQFGPRSGPTFCSVGPDLGPNCLQRLSADDESRR